MSQLQKWNYIIQGPESEQRDVTFDAYLKVSPEILSQAWVHADL